MIFLQNISRSSDLGSWTGIDLPGEARTDSLIYTADNMGPVDLATNAFGQNFNTTMIQLATAYCSWSMGKPLSAVCGKTDHR